MISFLSSSLFKTNIPQSLLRQNAAVGRWEDGATSAPALWGAEGVAEQLSSVWLPPGGAQVSAGERHPCCAQHTWALQPSQPVEDCCEQCQGVIGSICLVHTGH